MKKLLPFFLAPFLYLNLSAQNVGIGTTTPSARLEIVKPGGDTPSLIIQGSVIRSYFHDGPNEDTYIRGGKGTSHVILNDNGSGRVGLGMSTPGFPLNFS